MDDVSRRPRIFAQSSFLSSKFLFSPVRKLRATNPSRFVAQTTRYYTVCLRMNVVYGIQRERSLRELRGRKTRQKSAYRTGAATIRGRCTQTKIIVHDPHRYPVCEDTSNHQIACHHHRVLLPQSPSRDGTHTHAHDRAHVVALSYLAPGDPPPRVRFPSPWKTTLGWRRGSSSPPRRGGL